MEHGFYHPSRGYWQAIGGDPGDLLSSYPEGTTQVPIKPGDGYVWDGAEWTYVPPPMPTPEEIRETFPPLNPAQIRLALFSIGITEEMVEAKLAGNPQGLTEWRYRPSYRRTHHLVEALASQEYFDLPPEQVDTLWLWAAEL